MATVIGQIGSLKELKRKLSSLGITRFDSVASIARFKESYESEKNRIVEAHRQHLEIQLQAEEKRAAELAESITARIENNKNRLDAERVALRKKLERYYTKRSSPWNIIVSLFLGSSFRRLKYIENNWNAAINWNTGDLNSQLTAIQNWRTAVRADMNRAAWRSAQKELLESERTMTAIGSLDNDIAGAIGEKKVVDVLSKLPDTFVLINDFSLEFNPAIYNKAENDYIGSIQLDHILIGQPGVFLLETKNWSAKSIERLDLRSPASQIRRTSYALYRFLNNAIANGRLKLDQHHWGDKKLSFRNIIVMINNKPATEIQFVKILKLEELTGYINYFPRQLSEREVTLLTGFLQRVNHQIVES